MNHGEIVSFLWGLADLIRGSFKRGKYQVLERFDFASSRFDYLIANPDLVVFVPPIGEQAAICAHVDSATRALKDLVGRVGAAIDCLKELRTALISAAVTGKIDVREEVRA